MPRPILSRHCFACHGASRSRMYAASVLRRMVASSCWWSALADRRVAAPQQVRAMAGCAPRRPPLVVLVVEVCWVELRVLQGSPRAEATIYGVYALGDWRSAPAGAAVAGAVVALSRCPAPSCGVGETKKKKGSCINGTMKLEMNPLGYVGFK